MKLKFIYLFAILAMLTVSQRVSADVITPTADTDNGILFYGDYYNGYYFGGTGSYKVFYKDQYKGVLLNKTIDTRYVAITINNDASLAVGDVINVECCAATTKVTGVSVYLSNAENTTSIFSIKSSSTYLTVGEKTTLSYTVTASDGLVGQTTFYLGNSRDIYVSSVKITRTGHANAMPTVLSTKKTWTFGNFSAGDIQSSVINDQLYYGATTDNYMTISKTSSSYIGTTYTKYLNTVGTGSSVDNKSTSPIRACMFMVPAGAGKITIVANSSDASYDFYFQVGTTKSDLQSTTTALAEYTYSYNTAYDVPAYIYANTTNLNIYSISWEPTTPTVDLGATGYATYCSPCNLDLTKETSFTAYTASSYASGTLTMAQATQIPAGTGIIIKGTPSTTCYLTTSAPVPSISTNLLVGVTAATTVAASSTISGKEYYNFILTGTAPSDVTFKKSSGGTLAANKAYLQLLGTDVSGAASIQQIDFDGTVTGISEIMNIHTATTDGNYYNLQGVKVDNPSHGLYIQNGKKCMFK
jgi:hypothetical protein